MKAREARRASLPWLAVFVLVWWILVTPRTGVWVAGAVAVAVGGLFHTGLGGRGGYAMTARGLAGFIPYFLMQSVRGGLDVARRAFSPGPPLSPGFVDHRLSLPEGPPRIFFVNCLSLLPGTFSARVDGADVRVHLLADDGSGPERLGQLEAKVAALFGIRATA